jgi:hypothetical protein
MHRRAQPPAGRRRPSPAAAWLLVLVLLQAQALGLWHRVAHAPLHPKLHAAATVPAGHSAADAFGHDADDEARCRLYDAIGHAAAPLGEAPTQGVPPAVAHCGGGRAAVASLRQPPLYEARAPPA